MSCTGQAHCFSRTPSLLPSSLPAVQPAESLWSEKLEDDQKMSPFLERRTETERALRKNRAERGVLAGSPCPPHYPPASPTLPHNPHTPQCPTNFPRLGWKERKKEGLLPLPRSFQGHRAQKTHLETRTLPQEAETSSPERPSSMPSHPRGLGLLL